MLLTVGILMLLSAFAFGQTPQIFQEFTPASFNGITSTDGIWRINGPWVGTGKNTLDPALAHLSSTYPGDSGSGFLSLSVAPRQLRGSEIQTVTLPGYGCGYYETRMKVTSVPGVCASFFWIEAPHYGSHEWDIEFLTNEPWITSANSGKVHLTIHPSHETYVLDLPFNPSLGFHRYGFLWTPGSIAYTVDGQIAHTFTHPTLDTTAKGYIMMNMWTGNRDWGGGPPSEQATSVYDWVKFYPNVTSVPGEAIPLPKPQIEGGMRLMQSLKERQTSRSFSSVKLSQQLLSNLLWAADGANRPDGKRTAPTARNRQEIDVYVATADALYLYDARGNALQPVVEKDLRELTGMQPFVKDAPVSLVFVADYAKMGEGSESDKAVFAAADAGFVSQNVYLFCASEGLATGVRAMIPRDELAQAMKLRPDQKIVLAQCVGYPKK
jgi:nitroreductase